MTDPARTVTLLGFAALRGYKYGTVKRWIHEGMPVLRGHDGKACGVDPDQADTWLSAKRAAQRLGPRPRMNRETVVYFARRDTDGLIKIGFTSDLDQRLVDFRKKREGGAPVTLLVTIPGDKVTELAIHGRFAKYRVKGEWFSAGPELMEFICEQVKAA